MAPSCRKGQRQPAAPLRRQRPWRSWHRWAPAAVHPRARGWRPLAPVKLKANQTARPQASSRGRTHRAVTHAPRVARSRCKSGQAAVSLASPSRRSADALVSRLVLSRRRRQEGRGPCPVPGYGEARLVLQRREGSLDGVQERFRSAGPNTKPVPWSGSASASMTVSARPPDRAHDRRGAIAHGDELPLAAGLETRRHQEQVGTGIDAPSLVAIEAIEHRDAVGLLPG